MELARESPFLHLTLYLAQIAFVFGREIARDFKSRLRETITLAQQAIGFGQLAQALLRRDAREITDCEIAVFARAERRSYSLVIFQIDAEGDDVNLLARDAQVAGHVAGVIVADRDEGVDIFRMLVNQFERLAAIRLAHSVKKKVLALKRAADWASRGLLDRAGQPDQHRILHIYNIWRRLGFQPIHQLADLLALIAALAFEDRDRQFAERIGIDRDRPLRRCLEREL